MGTYIICGILVIVVVAALLGSKKHFKGEGGCEDQAETLRHHRSNEKTSDRRNVLHKLPEPH